MFDEELTVEEQIDVVEAIEESEEHDSSAEDENTKIKSEYNELLAKYKADYQHALFEFCFRHNIVFNGEIADLLLKNKSDGVYEMMPQLYIDTINADFRFNDLDFFSQLKLENFEKIYSEDLSVLSLTEDDKKNRQQVIETFSYDPFAKEAMKYKPQLYRDLASMTTESMRKDITKQKAALSIVRSYQNIENYQQQITEITSTGQVDDETQKKLDALLNTISKVQANINQTAEKNNFTVKGIGSNGKGILSDVMNQIEEYGIDEGIPNFYDIDTSKSIEEVSNISFKAQLNQVNLTKTDYADIMSEQCKIVKDAQLAAKKAIEAARLAKEKLAKQELIMELEIDYRKKGISEEEIQEFISREYHLYDGKE